MSDYRKINVRYSNFGLNICHDPITLPIGKFTQLHNVFSSFEGSLRSRIGLTAGSSSPTVNSPIIGARRLNNPPFGSALFVVRASTHLYISNSTIPLFVWSDADSGYSGTFGSLITYRPSISAVVWMYIFDTTKMTKTNGTLIHPIGYPRPHSVHTAGTNDFAATLGGSASGALTQSTIYYYRFSLYCSITGAESQYNLIPDGGITDDVNATTDLTHLNINVKIPDLSLATGSGGAQGGVNKVRIYRKGGSVATWVLITTQAYTGTSITYNDAAADIDVEALQPLDENSGQPFTTTDTSGNDNPGTPLPYSADPYLGYILAVGDVANPGYLYWTNKFDPDRQDPDNRIEVTSPQDPLQNVFIYNGAPLVFSKEALFQLYVGLSSATFTPSQTACNHGLFTPLAMCVGPEIYFMAKDGIYATSGGVERSLTDDEMRPIFRGTTVGIYEPIDFTQPQYMRMTYFQNEVYFTFRSATNTVWTYIYDVRYGRWRTLTSAAYSISTLYADEETVSQLWIGSTNGFLVANSGQGDDGTGVSCFVRTGVMALGAPLINKEFSSLVFDVNPNGNTITFTVTMNNQNGTLVTKTTSSASGARTKVYLDLASTFAEDVQIQLTWSQTSGNPTIYGYELLYRMEEPQLITWAVNGVTHGLQGWQTVRSGYFTLIANGTVILTVSVLTDAGTLSSNAYTLSPGANFRTKLFQPFVATKGKIFNYTLTCGTATSFRFYPELSEIHVKPWVSSMSYAVVNPFGGGAGEIAGAGDGGSSGAGNPMGGGGAGGGGSNAGLSNALLNSPAFNATGGQTFSGGGGTSLTPPGQPSIYTDPNNPTATTYFNTTQNGASWQLGAPDSGDPNDPTSVTSVDPRTGA